MKEINFIDLKSQYKTLKSRIDDRISSVLDHGSYILGQEVLELEKKLADYVGVKHAVTCANGTDALSLCMMVLDVKTNDAVFCPTFTFFATAEAIAHSGATPVFVDSDSNTFNICPKDLERRIQSVIDEGVLNLKAIIAVDLFGLPANYSELERIATKYGMALIEDAAQGFGGEINGSKAGSFGDMATTSFFPAKPLGCYGDGGAIFTNNDKFADLLRSLRLHGKGVDKYDNIRIGMNSRLDTIQAAILLEKLEAFPNELKKRNHVAEKYTVNLSERFITPTVPDGYYSSWAQYTLIDEDRDSIIHKSGKLGIPVMIYYGKCMHQQTAFSYLGYKSEDFPVAESLAKTVFSIPMHAYLQENEQTYIINGI